MEEAILDDEELLPKDSSSDQFFDQRIRDRKAMLFAGPEETVFEIDC